MNFVTAQIMNTMLSQIRLGSLNGHANKDVGSQKKYLFES